MFFFLERQCRAPLFNLLTFRTLMLVCYFCTLSFLPCASHLQQQSFPSPHPSHCGFLAVRVLYILCERYASAAATMTIVAIYCHIICCQAIFCKRLRLMFSQQCCASICSVRCFSCMSARMFRKTQRGIPSGLPR